MLRACVLCCAVAASAVLVVGCDKPTTVEVKIPARDDLVKDWNDKMKDLDKKVADLKEKAAKATGDEKVKLDAKVKEAGEKRDAFAKKFEEMKKAGADKWESFKKDAQSTFAKLHTNPHRRRRPHSVPTRTTNSTNHAVRNPFEWFRRQSG